MTGFLLKIDTSANAMFLADHRPLGQGLLPHTIYVRQPEPGGFHTWIRFEIAAWKIGDLIDDSTFEIPVGS